MKLPGLRFEFRKAQVWNLNHSLRDLLFDPGFGFLVTIATSESKEIKSEGVQQQTVLGIFFFKFPGGFSKSKSLLSS